MIVKALNGLALTYLAVPLKEHHSAETGLLLIEMIILFAPKF